MVRELTCLVGYDLHVLAGKVYVGLKRWGVYQSIRCIQRVK